MILLYAIAIFLISGALLIAIPVLTDNILENMRIEKEKKKLGMGGKK